MDILTLLDRIELGAREFSAGLITEHEVKHLALEAIVQYTNENFIFVGDCVAQ